jgi:hypothetical protein
MNHHPSKTAPKSRCTPQINKGVHMLDQFFSPIAPHKILSHNNSKGFQKPDRTKDTNQKPEETKIRKAVEIKFLQNALPEEFPAKEEYPVIREYSHLPTDSSDYPYHRSGFWPLNNNFFPTFN